MLRIGRLEEATGPAWWVVGDANCLPPHFLPHYSNDNLLHFVGWGLRALQEFLHHTPEFSSYVCTEILKTYLFVYQ